MATNKTVLSNKNVFELINKTFAFALNQLKKLSEQ